MVAARPDLDDRIERWRLRSASTEDLRGALATASVGVAVPLSLSRHQLIAACEAADVVPRRH